MEQEPQEQVRQALLDQLISLVSDDTYPSNTMTDMVEELLTPRRHRALHRGVSGMRRSSTTSTYTFQPS